MFSWKNRKQQIQTGPINNYTIQIAPVYMAYHYYYKSSGDCWSSQLDGRSQTPCPNTTTAALGAQCRLGARGRGISCLRINTTPLPSKNTSESPARGVFVVVVLYYTILLIGPIHYYCRISICSFSARPRPVFLCIYILFCFFNCPSHDTYFL